MSKQVKIKKKKNLIPTFVLENMKPHRVESARNFAMFFDGSKYFLEKLRQFFFSLQCKWASLEQNGTWVVTSIKKGTH